MAFNDLLSTSFLFSVAIIIILIGGIFAYVSYRMSEQDHKITSMVGLISTMAEELQFFRSKLSQGQGQGQQGGLFKQENASDQIHSIPILDPNNLITGATNLIPVSDDEAETEDDEETVSDDEEESQTDDESVSDDEEGSEDEEYDLDEIVDLEEPMQISTISVDEKIDETNHSDIKSIHLEEPIELNVFNPELEHELEHTEDLLASDLKTISITDLEDTNKKTDYKKMTINKLREVVIEKGIVADATKLKKNEILKLLGDE
jgi:hypothetical protein